MAKRLGISRGTYIGYETGRKSVRVLVAHAVRWIEHTDRRR
jgi:DNA-binding XRE family transcriptional regulator